MGLHANPDPIKTQVSKLLCVINVFSTCLLGPNARDSVSVRAEVCWAVNRHVPAQGGPGPVFWGKHHLMLGLLIAADSRSLCPLDTEPKGTCNQIIGTSFIGLAGSGQDEYVMCVNARVIDQELVTNQTIIKRRSD